MKFYLSPLLLLLFAFATSAHAQKASGKIIGSVVDENSTALPFSSIVVSSAKDSSMVVGQTADENGKFSFEKIPNGLYMVTASMVGYQRSTSSAFQIDDNTIQLPSLQLLHASRDLQEVAVVAKRPFVEQLVDKTVINVASSISSTGGSALQVLEKSPSVSVNAHQEQIELAGKSNPLVMIDGKPTYLSQADLFNLLKNTPSENIEKIELITNPSSRYDAAGNSGIINIIFKKGSKPGTNGSASISGSIITHGYGRGSIATSINHSEGRLNLFASLNGMEGKGFSKTIYDRTIVDGPTQVRFDQVYGNLHWLKNYGYRAGADYNLGNNTRIGAKIYGTLNKLKTLSRYSDTKLYNADFTLKQKYYTNAHTNDRRDNINANVNFDHSSKSGLGINFDADYLAYTGIKVNSLTTHFYKPDENLDGPPQVVRNTMPLSIRIGVAKLDFNKKVGKFNFEGGVKSSFVKADNEMVYEDFENQWIVDSLRSNRFIYKENINAAYFSFRRPLTPGVTLQLGLRLEHTRLSGHSTTLKKLNEQNYIRPFPTLFLSHVLNAAHTLTWSYGYRIDRPNYQLLNPFESYLDPYTTLRGNPDLQPQFTNNFQFTHLFRGVVNTNIAYAITRNLIVNEFPSITKNDSKMSLSPENMSFSRHISITISAPLALTSWWNLQASLSGRLSRYRTFYKQDQFLVKQPTLSLMMSNTLSFGKEWSGEISGNYMSRRVYGLLTCPPIGAVNLGVQKTFFQKKASVKFIGQDVFWTSKFVGSTHFADLDLTVQSLGVSQTFTISLSYKFGAQNLSKEKPTNSNAEEFQKRASGGS
ncbi:outer membrane beta-barrel protein [Dyadobacter beijingensis]|nr:outer membrane beta-barrel protein [Dyadobacter beijingensis]